MSSINASADEAHRIQKCDGNHSFQFPVRNVVDYNLILKKFIVLSKNMNQKLHSDLRQLELDNHRDRNFADSVALTEFYLQAHKNLQELHNQRDDLNQRMKDIKEGRSADLLSLDVNELKNQILSLYQEKDKKNAEIDSIKSEIQSNQAIKSQLETKYAELTDAKSKLDNQVTLLEQQNQELRSKEEISTNRLNEIMTQIQKSTAEVEQQETLLFDYKQKIEESRRFIHEAEKNTIHKPLLHFHTTITGNLESITAIDFSQSYDSFYTLSKDRKMVQWELPSLYEKRSLSISGPPTTFRTNHEIHVSAVSTDKFIELLDLTTGRNIGKLTGHTDLCTDSFWISKNQLISSSKDRTVKIFDINRKQSVATISAASATFTISPTINPVVFAVGGVDGRIRLIDLRQHSVAKVISNIHNRQITCLLPSSSRQSLYSLSLDNTLNEVSVEAEKIIKKLAKPSPNDKSELAPENSGDIPTIRISNQFTKMSISPIGDFLSVGTDCGAVFLFDLHQSGVVHKLSKHKKPVLCSTMASNLLITVDTSNVVNFWT